MSIATPATGPTPHIQSGTIKGYAINQQEARPSLPDVPTSAEAGLPAFDVTTWYGLYAPRGTPKPVIATLVAALQTALKDPALISRFAELSMAPVEEERATPEALEAFLKAEVGKWGRIIKGRGNRAAVGAKSTAASKAGSRFVRPFFRQLF
jgi:tripartite-type tricarboxylate transporter receptor subunit TctC